MAEWSRAAGVSLSIPRAWAVLGYWLMQSLVLGGWALPAAGLTIDFDDVSEPAPSSFGEVVPGVGFGPDLSYGFVDLSGGVIGLAISPSDAAATTLPNYYATSDFLGLADGSLLPGEVTGLTGQVVSSVALDVGNGNSFAATFTLSAYSGTSLVGQHALTLEGFSSGSSFVGHLQVEGPGIDRFVVSSDQPTGSKLFTVDSLALVIPEPGTGVLVGSGLLLLSLLRPQGPIRTARPHKSSGEVVE